MLRCPPWWTLLVLVGCGAPPPPAPPAARPPPAAEAPPPPPAPPAAPMTTGRARARVLQATDAETVAGIGARPGDLVVENAHVAIIVAGLGHRAASGGTGGHVVAVVPTRGADALGEMVPVLDVAGARIPRFQSVVVAHDGASGGAAIIRALGTDPKDDQVEVAVDYLVEPDARFARVVRAVHNRGRGHYRELSGGHLVSWGELQPFVPGVGTELVGQRTRSDWVGGDGPRGSLVITPGTGRLIAVHGRDWAVLGPATSYLAPAASVVTETHVFTSPDAGVAGAADALYARRRVVRGTITGQILERGGGTVPGAWITVLDAHGLPVNRARSDAGGLFRLTARPGTYTLYATGPGRAPGPPVSFRLGADDEDQVRLLLEPPSALAVQVTDAEGQPLAARVRLEGVDGTPTPTLGPVGGAPAAGSELLLERGALRHVVPPGRYRARVHAGPRHAVAATEVQVPVGGVAELEVRLARAFEAPEWILLDPHVRTWASPTSSTAPAARVAACAAAGVDALVLTDEARATPPPRHRGGGPRVYAGVGLSAPDEGRFAALPAPVGSVPTPTGARAADALAALRGVPGARVAVLYPRSAGWGYFAHFAFDPEAPALPRGGFSLDFDLLEVAVPGNDAAVAAAFADYRGLLDRGRAVVPLGGSGADAVAGQPCGVPGTWVRGRPDDDPQSLAALLAGGDVVVGFGPLVDLSVGGARPGGEVVEGAAPLIAEVRVRAPDWARPDVLRLWVDNAVAQTVRLRGRGALDQVHRLRVPAGASWVLAEVDGDTDLSDAVGRPARPFAFTAPVRVRRAGP